MAHYAKIENDIVTEVIVAEQDFIDTLDGEWVQTSYNTAGNKHLLGGTPLRGNYAFIGFTYDRDNDVFYEPKPFGSWTLNTSIWHYEAPLPRPADDVKNGGDVFYEWDEDAYQADNAMGLVEIAAPD